MRTLWSRWSRSSSSDEPHGRTDQTDRTKEERDYYALNYGVYARIAQAYDLVVRPMRHLRRNVVELSGVRPDAAVLDLATGTGEQARAFAAKCQRVVGVDLSEAMLRVARAKTGMPNLSYVRADATDLPFSDATFDVTAISFALHEMPISIRDAVLGQMLRVTKPGGTLVVVDWGLPRGLLRRPIIFHVVRFVEDAHYAEFVRLDLAALLTAKGIDVSDDRLMLFGAVRVLKGTKPT